MCAIAQCVDFVRPLRSTSSAPRALGFPLLDLEVMVSLLSLLSGLAGLAGSHVYIEVDSVSR